MTFNRFVITGTGRSGTKYAHKLFSRMGIACAHQGIYQAAGIKPWGKYIGDSSGLAAPHVGELPSTTLVIHQVRNPWRTIRSLVHARHVPGQSGTPGTLVYERHTNLPETDDLFLRAAHLWVQWNTLVEKQMRGKSNYLFHRVEDYSDETLTHICELIGHPYTEDMASVFVKIAKNEGSVHPKGPLPDLEAMPDEFWSMCDRYGYLHP